MKNIAKLFVAAIAIVGFSVDASAQQTATATANTSATIIQPISITKTSDLSFGNVAVSNSNAGTVTITPGGTRSAGGGVTLPATTGTISVASFDIAGAANYTYAIQLPTDVELDDNDNHTMEVNTFVSSVGGTGTLDGSGEQTITVGATLNVSAAQTPGVYESDDDFEVTVYYN